MSGRDFDESALIQRCQKGDQDAIRRLIELYQGPVFHLVWRTVGNEEDARDLVQESFVRALRALDRFDRSRPFRNWIFRIAQNLAIDHLRRSRIRTVSLDADEGDPAGLRPPVIADDGPGPEENYEQTWLQGRLASLVASLPSEYRTVIHLRHREQLAYEEIAQVLGIPLGTVKARLHRAHRRLRDLWAESDGETTGEGRD